MIGSKTSPTSVDTGLATRGEWRIITLEKMTLACGEITEALASTITVACACPIAIDAKSGALTFTLRHKK
jgi:hypothetical protein